ncbi:MAG: protein tyrosine phosphatase [Alphaproteobacteria bacterium]
MPRIIVSPVTHIDKVTRDHDPSYIVSLIGEEFMPPTPSGYDPDRHIKLAMQDIHTPQDGMIMPGEDHARRVIDIAAQWDQQKPLLVHCWAGVSRSGAAALITLAVLNPGREVEAGQHMRACSPWARPNPALIEAADKLLGTRGRLVNAALKMGPGNVDLHGRPYDIPLVF